MRIILLELLVIRRKLKIKGNGLKTWWWSLCEKGRRGKFSSYVFLFCIKYIMHVYNCNQNIFNSNPNLLTLSGKKFSTKNGKNVLLNKSLG